MPKKIILLRHYLLIAFFNASFATASQRPEIPNTNTINIPTGWNGAFQQFVKSDKIYQIKQGLDETKSLLENIASALQEGSFNAVKSTPEITGHQLILLAIKSVISYASGDTTTQFNKCTSLLSLAITAKNLQNDKGYHIAINCYRDEMEKIKKLSHDQLMVLATHIEGLRNTGEEILADWQDENFNRLLSKKGVENYKNFSERGISKLQHVKNKSQHLLKKLQEKRYNGLRTLGKSSILLKERRKNG